MSKTSVSTSRRCHKKGGNKKVSWTEVRAQLLQEMGEILESEEFGQLGEQLVAAGTLAEKENLLVRMRTLLMQRFTQASVGTETGYQGASAPCPECGGRARFVRHDRKRYVLLTGEIELARSLYECGCGDRWRPLDQAWKLPAGRLSGGVERVVARLGAEVPFEEAAETLWEAAGLSVSPSQVQAVTEGVGEAIGQQMAQEEREAAGGQEGGAPPPEVLVTGADGAMVHTREEGWKEVKVGPVLHYRRRDKETLELASRSYVAHLGSVEEFRPKLDHEIQRRGGPGTERTLFLGDGSPWVWEMAAEILPEAIQVLDYYHLP